ncbi:MAG: DNA polymerase I [Lachnospiraceae bacterium]|nr:DNA polymerase I [Lachnospiraceae bacterium]
MNDYLLIIDGSSLLSTQFYGNIPREILMAKTVEEKEKYYHKIMKTSKGVYTNAVYGFLRTLFSILDKQKPRYLAVTWDLTRNTFRRELYEDYKANRSETIEPLKDQFVLMQEILKEMGVAQFMDERYEADDFSGSIADKFSTSVEVCIMTKDHDYLQLVDDNVKLWLIVSDQKKADEFFKKYNLDKSVTIVPEKTEWLNAGLVKAEFGVEPESIPSLKALMGDSADNIKGVPGIGDKAAVPLIAHYKTVDALYDDIHNSSDLKELALKWKNELGISRNPISFLTKESETELVGEKAARLSEKLATIIRDLPIDKELDDLRTEYDYATLVKILEELEISSLQIPASISHETKEDDFYKEFNDGLVIMSDPSDVLEFSEKSAKIAENKEAGIAVVLNDGEISELAVCIDKTTYSFKTEYFVTAQILEEILDKVSGAAAYVASDNYKNILKAGQEAKEDFFDFSVAHYLLDPNSTKHDVQSLLSYLEVYPSQVSDMTAFTAYTAIQKKDEVIEKLEENGLINVYNEAEKPLIPILCDMEREGIICRVDVLEEQGRELDKAMKDLEEEIYSLASERFNILSPKQLGVILFEKLGLPGAKKTKTGYSTNADVLEKLKDEHPVIPKILEYRTVSKLKSTYVEGLKECIKDDGRIHCTFNQTVTATGRLSCTEPNLQNIPVREELGRKLRKAFVPKPGCVFVDADYSQIELRIMAHMAGDEKLLDDYRNARDIHRATAANVFHVPYDQVTKKQRSEAKAVNFGIIYGISSFGLGQDLDISRKTAEGYIKSYFEQYPQVKAYMDRLVESAKDKGYAETLLGRKRPIPELSSSNFMQRSFGERVAMNMPIQGTAADIMKLAMIKVHNALKKAGLRSKMLLQIHDEILIEAYEDEKEEVKNILIEEMKGAVRLAVELEVDANIADSWFDVK